MSHIAGLHGALEVSSKDTYSDGEGVAWYRLQRQSETRLAVNVRYAGCHSDLVTGKKAALVRLPNWMRRGILYSAWRSDQP